MPAKKSNGHGLAVLVAPAIIHSPSNSGNADDVVDAVMGAGREPLADVEAVVERQRVYLLDNRLGRTRRRQRNGDQFTYQHNRPSYDARKPEGRRPNHRSVTIAVSRGPDQFQMM